MKLMSLIRKLLHFVKLDSEMDDHDKIHEIIRKDVIFKGTNLWILMFAILVASVGLNMNSTAVIIGAMLISPLMGPINGVGYSIATYNFPLFKISVKNFAFAVATALFTSTLYFAISPISTAHSEILARTSPTIYDVLIALFGGLAGILATSSKQKGNVIPGVAIATALMPPLCTAGYGLATGQLHFLFGALYLFTINSVFIALSAMLVSQILKFPIRQGISYMQKKKINRIISLVIVLMIIPSVYFGYNLVQREKFIDNANLFVKSVSVFEGRFLLKHEIDPSTKTIRLAYGGRAFSDDERKTVVDIAKDFSLKNSSIIFQQGLTFEDADERIAEVERLKYELDKMNLVITKKDKAIDSLKNSHVVGKQLLSEIHSLYPQVVSITYASSYMYERAAKEPVQTDVIVLGVREPIDNEDDVERIQRFFKSRLQAKLVKVFYETTAPKQAQAISRQTPN